MDQRTLTKRRRRKKRSFNWKTQTLGYGPITDSSSSSSYASSSESSVEEVDKTRKFDDDKSEREEAERAVHYKVKTELHTADVDSMTGEPASNLPHVGPQPGETSLHPQNPELMRVRRYTFKIPPRMSSSGSKNVNSNNTGETKAGGRARRTHNQRLGPITDSSSSCSDVSSSESKFEDHARVVDKTRKFDEGKSKREEAEGAENYNLKTESNTTGLDSTTGKRAANLPDVGPESEKTAVHPQKTIPSLMHSSGSKNALPKSSKSGESKPGGRAHRKNVKIPPPLLPSRQIQYMEEGSEFESEERSEKDNMNGPTSSRNVVVVEGPSSPASKVSAVEVREPNMQVPVQNQTRFMRKGASDHGVHVNRPSMSLPQRSQRPSFTQNRNVWARNYEFARKRRRTRFEENSFAQATRRQLESQYIKSRWADEPFRRVKWVTGRLRGPDIHRRGLFGVFITESEAKELLVNNKELLQEIRDDFREVYHKSFIYIDRRKKFFPGWRVLWIKGPGALVSFVLSSLRWGLDYHIVKSTLPPTPPIRPFMTNFPILRFHIGYRLFVAENTPFCCSCLETGHISYDRYECKIHDDE